MKYNNLKDRTKQFSISTFNLVDETGLIENERVQKFKKESDELIRIFVRSVKTVKNTLDNAK